MHENMKGVPGSHEPLTWERLQTLQTQTHFDHIELEALYEEYKSLAPTDQGITKSIFEKCLGPLGQEKNLIAERIFQFFDTDGNDQIDFSELVHGLSVLCKGNLDEKALYAFHGYDLNGDGHIDQDELHAMFKAYFHLSMELVRDIVKALEEEMMDSFDDENNKPVSAMFTAPIPPSSTPPTSTSLTTPRPSSSSPSSSSSSSSSFQDFQPPIYNEKEPLEDPSSTSRLELPTLTDQAPSGTSHPPLLPPPPPSSSSSSSSSLPSPLHPEEVSMTPRYKPIMEQMSQDAIAEMVQKTFQSMDIHRKGYIEFPEFKTYVENDSTLISWFETLGSVF
ncbi:hypothetical protein HMI56_002495 [Coelomomyces lativittatus]|nr:hypothetical protein HMI56_002495 [Coelomomyces lativittatus]